MTGTVHGPESAPVVGGRRDQLQGLIRAAKLDGGRWLNQPAAITTLAEVLLELLAEGEPEAKPARTMPQLQRELGDES